MSYYYAYIILLFAEIRYIAGENKITASYYITPANGFSLENKDGAYNSNIFGTKIEFKYIIGYARSFYGPLTIS